jgi:alkylhydroperoxidase family enzyme
MSRIPLVPVDLAEPKTVVEAIRQRRGGTLSDLDRLLLHSPNLAEGWNTFLGTVRQRLSLDPKLREIIMCSIAVLNDAEYEFFHHAPELIRAGGTEAQVDALRTIAEQTPDPTLFDDAERAVIQLSIEMTRSVKVEPETLALVRQTLSKDQPTVEAVATAAAYNMVSRVIVACDLHPETERH